MRGPLSDPCSASPLLPQVSLLEELLSPLLTPLFLLFWFRPRALEIIDFFHHFTVDVAGVGDICSFALMDVKRHGHPQVRAVPWPWGVGLGGRLLASRSRPGFQPWRHCLLPVPLSKSLPFPVPLCPHLSDGDNGNVPSRAQPRPGL